MFDRISVDPKVCYGQACVKGTRIPVHQIVGMLADGDTIESLLRAYPTISREDILACLEYRTPPLKLNGGQLSNKTQNDKLSS